VVARLGNISRIGLFFSMLLAAEKLAQATIVAWNNSFREKKLAVAGEKACHVFQFHCECLPMSYRADQRKILFWR